MLARSVPKPRGAGRQMVFGERTPAAEGRLRVGQKPATMHPRTPSNLMRPFWSIRQVFPLRGGLGVFFNI
jgi:hypothetical protein